MFFLHFFGSGLSTTENQIFTVRINDRFKFFFDFINEFRISHHNIVFLTITFYKFYSFIDRRAKLKEAI